jgi:hypothetical protein
VQEGDAAEPRAGGCGSVGGPGDACGSARQPLDLIKKDPREGRDCRGAVGKHAAQDWGGLEFDSFGDSKERLPGIV